MTFYVKILRKDRSRKWHVENVAVVAASSEEEAIKKIKGFYPQRGKNTTGIRRMFKIGKPILNMKRGCHGTIRDSISPKHNVNPKIFGPY
jgi:hypothetical protein